MSLILLLVLTFLFLLIFGGEKLYKLTLKKEFYQNMLEEKEKTRTSLEKKLKITLYPGYAALLLSFLGISCLFSSMVFHEITFDNVMKGAIITDTIIFLMLLVITHQVHEFKYLLGQLKSFLKKRIFKEEINIDQEIEKIQKRIAKIDKKLRKYKMAFN